MGKNSTPVGHGYDYFANSTLFLSRLKSRPILDVTDDLLEITSMKENDVSIETKENINDFFTAFDIQTELKGQYKMFSAAAAGGFKTSSDSHHQYAYTRIVAVHRRCKHTFKGLLKNHLDKVFAIDINGDRENDELNPIKLQEKYGTHVVTDAILGGLIEILVVTQRDENETCEEVNTKVEAAYGAMVSSSVSTNNQNIIHEISKRSTMTSKVIGGKSMAMSNFQDFHKNYAEWAESLNDPKNLEFCGFHEGTFNSSCISIAELAAKQERKDCILKQFESDRKDKKEIFVSDFHSKLAEEDYRIYNNDMVTALTQYSVNKAMRKYIDNGYRLGDEKYPRVAAFVLETPEKQQATQTNKNTSGRRPRRQAKPKMVTFFLYSNTDVEKELPEDFPEKLRRADLFDVINNLGLDEVVVDSEGGLSDEHGGIIDEAFFDYKVTNAVIFEFGFPKFYTSTDKTEFKPIELLAEGNGSAFFTQTFSFFKAMTLSDDGQYAGIQYYSQDDDLIEKDVNYGKQAALFKAKIEFNLGTASSVEKMTDKKAQKEILQHFKILDGLKESYTDEELEAASRRVDRMYSMEQLYLDFNTLANITIPEFQGFGLASKGNFALMLPIMLKQNLQDKVILGRAFLNKEYKRDENKKYAVLPTGYVFSVTGSDSGDDDLTTLNYVINLGENHATGNDVITPQPFNWTWVEPGRKCLQSGVSVINRETIFSRVLRTFEKNVLPDLCLDSTARIDGKIVGDLDWIVKLTQTDDDVLIPRFCYDDRKKKYIFGKTTKDGYANPNEWGWTTEGHQEKKAIWIPPTFGASCELFLRYFMSANATWGSKVLKNKVLPAIIFDVKVKAWTNIIWNEGETHGDVYNSQLLCYLVIDIDDAGNMNLTPYVDEIDLGTGLSRSAWSQFCTFGDIDHVYDGITDNCRKAVKNAIDDFTKAFVKAFNIGTGWVLPGQGTFTFANERFSTFGDFAVDVNYYDVDN